MLLFALVRAIEIIGEAASRVSIETRSVAPAVPWSTITAIRNRLIHAYFDINRDILWKATRPEAVFAWLQDHCRSHALDPLVNAADSLTAEFLRREGPK